MVIGTWWIVTARNPFDFVAVGAVKISERLLSVRLFNDNNGAAGSRITACHDPHATKQ